jgi:hypothetical protein
MRKLGYCIQFAVLAFFTTRITWASSLDKTTFDSMPEAACAQSGRVCALDGFTRRQVLNDIYEYIFTLHVGQDPHDVIRIHRVVRESVPNHPIQAPHSIFMVHGDVWGFDAAFLGSALTPSVAQDQSIGVFLAKNNIDVWGLDTRRIQVPANTTDFTFMRPWNMQTDVNDIGVGLAFARVARGLTGSDFGKMTLMGWSRGGLDMYAYMNQESQRRPIERNVKAMIPVDIAFKYGPDGDAQRQGLCRAYGPLKASFDAGVSEGGISGPTPGLVLQTIGSLAAVAPNDPSPIAPGLTNLLTALFGGAATFAILPPDIVPAPFYHFTAGIFDPNIGIPTGLQYSDLSYTLNFLQAGAPYQSLAEVIDSVVVQCGQTSTAYDEHLGDIDVPVLYMGAAGGYGTLGIYSTTLLGSQDVTTHVVQLHPTEERAADFGHADLFIANHAQTLVWQPIYDWLLLH